jgi:ribosomal protein S12 methylthiotransferase
MRRPGDQAKTLDRIKQWRAACPDLALRSTFIVGFPGETEEDFDYLLAWLEEARLDRVGAFKYEPVSGAAANDLGLPLVPAEVAESRYRRFMQHQQAISANLLKRKVGRHIQAIVDKAGPSVAEGRSKADAPEIDGKVHIASRRPLRPGDIVSVKIERADAYDLFGTAA